MSDLQETKQWVRYNAGFKPKRVREEINKLSKEQLIEIVLSDRQERGSLVSGLENKEADNYKKTPKQTLQEEVYARAVRINKRDKEGDRKIWLDKAGRYKVDIRKD